jgi:hypothetical protein
MKIDKFVKVRIHYVFCVWYLAGDIACHVNLPPPQTQTPNTKHQKLNAKHSEAMIKGLSKFYDPPGVGVD